MRRAALASVGMCAALLLALSPRPRDWVLHNDSPSMPTGFYLRSNAPIEIGAIVTVRARDVADNYARLRKFAGSRDRFIKRVAGAAGDRICADGAHMTMNGAQIATRLDIDHQGRRLPSWSGCRTLNRQEYVLMGMAPDSFDSRYWGIVSSDVIEGVWRPLFVNRVGKQMDGKG